MIRILSSPGLAVALCLLLAAAGMVGSVVYEGNTAFDRLGGAVNVFRSPLFLVPAGLLVLNIVFCMTRRLAARGFGTARSFTFAGIHLALVALAAGLFLDGLYGFVGTQYFLAGVPSSGYFNWRTNRDESFPFTIEIRDVKVSYHPTNLRVGVKDAAGNKLGTYTVREGIPFTVEKTGLVVTPGRLDPESKSLAFDAASGGRLYRASTAGPGRSAALPGHEVVLLAYHEPEPSGYAVNARFTLPGRPPEEKVIRINDPATFSGISFCFVGENRDRYGNPLIGIQMTREPGEPLFWAGALLFAVSLLGHLYLKRAPVGAGAASVATDRAANGEAAGGTSNEEAGTRAGGTERAPGAHAGSALIVLAATAAWLAGLLPAAATASDGAFTARTPVRGTVITGETTWEGKVRVDAPVTVEKGGTLRLRPGTTVLLAGEDRDGDGCRDGYIQVFGSVFVEGERSRPVRFLPSDPGRGWQEIFLKDAVGRIRYAVFEGATWGLHIHDGDVLVEETLFRGNGGGAKLKGRGAAFARCTFRGNGVGLRFWDGGPSVRGAVIEGNAVGIFYREGAGGGRITGSRIANAEWDLKVGDWAAGELDVSGNFWGRGGEGGSGRRVKDYRGEGGEGIVFTPSLDAPPAGCGASLAEDP